MGSTRLFHKNDFVMGLGKRYADSGYLYGSRLVFTGHFCQVLQTGDSVIRTARSVCAVMYLQLGIGCCLQLAMPPVDQGGFN